ncbi:hypothetical protein F2Q69_00008143 [Brassica cretica]|uniref:Uncharacterized protein n=1 Tax=Brassica cretica TaxID=69181 RepID=A0A8S9P6B2_BRACR|nr:hypothetical protein F2Q69_00008143 [Brassica cretica]
MHGLMSYRCSEGSNRYTATELRLEPGCYVATVRDELSVATDRALTRSRSLRIDRVGRVLGRYVATELVSAQARSLHSDRAGRSLRSDRALARARSLRSD